MNEIEISKELENQRLDKFLLKYFNKAQKSFVYKMLRKKRIKLNGGRAEGNEILKAGDVVKFYLSAETMDSFMEERLLKSSNSQIEIVFEDENILVCNKPAGLLSHSESSTDNDTMIDRILAYLYGGQQSIAKGAAFVPALCNRLDRNTSGLVICGKNLAAVQELNSIFARRKADKFYFAIVLGTIIESMVLEGYHVKDEAINKAEISLEQNSENNKSDKSGKSSKKIITEVYPVRTGKGLTLVKIKLVTGKTHQIRAHLSSIGHPVLGDDKYGDIQANKSFKIRGQLLHAEELILKEDTGALAYLNGIKFTAPRPELFQKLI